MDRVNVLIRSASDFARNAHGDQIRKYSTEPYWLHLNEVVMTLRRFGATPDVIAAGYLHDTLEDTKTTYQDLVMTFGHGIANLVMEVTDVSRPDSGNTPERIGNRPLRKAIDRQYLAGASWQGQMIKCSDMLSNTKNIVALDKHFARVYVPENRALIDVLDKVRKVNYPIWRAAYDSIEDAEEVLHAAA